MHSLHYARPVRRALQLANSVTTSYSATILPQMLQPNARPSGDGVIDLAQDGGGWVPSHVKIWGIGTGTGGNNIGVRVYGWNQILPQGAQPPMPIWFPQLISDVTLKIGTTAGVANGVVSATELFSTAVSAINLDPVQVNQTGTFGETINTSPSGGALIGYIIVPIHGAQLLQFDIFCGTSITGANVLYSLIN